MASFLPHEIIIEILSRLPVKFLIRFKCVCKAWFDLMKNPSFVQIHLQRATENGNFNLMSNDNGRVYSIDDYDVVSPPEDEIEQITYPFNFHIVKFLGSCNGLICLTVEKPHSKLINYLWNPATKETMELPYDDLRDYRCLTARAYGFGYDYKTENYKVVMITYSLSNQANHRLQPIVKVYTLGSNSWRRIGDIPYLLHKSSIGLPGIYVNRALHWVANHGKRTETSPNKLIVSLDLGDEEYREVPQPDYSDHDTDMKMDVGVLEGCLCIIRTDFQWSYACIWIMKEYGVRESWNKLLSVSHSVGIDEDLVRVTPIKILKNGNVLLNSCGLMLYDSTNRRVRHLEIRGKHYNPLFDAVAYVSSLVSLNSD